MKEIFCILVTLFATISLFANVQGHFFLNVESENVQVAQAESHFTQWLDLPANTTFALFRDTTDNIGIRHLSYQQFVNGTEVANSMILVHAKNNVVFAVNGDIMEASSTAQQVHRKITANEAISKVRKKANSTAAPLKIVRATINGETIYRYAYEVLSEDATSQQYVDAETGEVIKTKPLVYNADVIGTAMTMYNGTQPITCYEYEGAYYLRDEGRGIITLNATNNEYALNQIFYMQDKEAASAELLSYISNCLDISNPTTTFGGYWMMLLKSVTINNVSQNSNWYSIGEGTADVYIKIKDGSGNVKFTSSRYDDPTFPLTFNIGMQVETPPYYIEVWDYDPIGSDDLIETIAIETIRGENKTYNEFDFTQYPSIVELAYRIESSGRYPFLDAHWGMEKTIDFYREKFNRNSYDNKGSIVYQLVNPPSSLVGPMERMFANASAVEEIDPSFMLYGMGYVSSNSSMRLSSMRPLVCVDVMAHEFTHLVTSRNGNGGLVYIGEAGALNESFSDIIGVSVKQYATGQNDWLIGSDMMIYVSNLRSMINPKNGLDGYDAQPNTFNGQYWADITDVSATGDYGGVHTNSGVQNYWYYLLCEGGSGTNDLSNAYNVIGIGMDKALQIAYRNLIFYLTPEATFEDARNGSIQAAIDLYGEDSQEHKSVINAWYAVGVGDKYTAGEDEATEYYIVAKRSSGNYYFFTPEKVSGKNRLVAVDAGTSIRTSIDTINTTSDYLWTFEGNKLKNHNGQYLSCTSAKSAVMNDTGIELVKTDNSDGTVTFTHAASETETWYFSLALAGNDYFVFYANANQITHLLMLPKGNGSTTPLTNTNVAPEAIKILHNGQLFILRGDNIYTLQGQKIK